MNSAANGGDSAPLKGQKHLYQQPELLTNEAHGDLGFIKAERPFDFVADTIAVPVTTPEFGQAQKDFPIVFSEMENPIALAIMGIPDGKNLFVTGSGGWDSNSYLPGYMRCHPFALAPQGDKVAVVVDVLAKCVSKSPEHPFFVDGKPSPQTEELINFCGQFESARHRTVEYCKRLKELDLLSPQRTSRNPDTDKEETIADFVGIDVRKLEKLDDAVVLELYKSGILQLVYLQLNSLDNWRKLIARSERRAAETA